MLIMSGSSFFFFFFFFSLSLYLQMETLISHPVLSLIAFSTSRSSLFFAYTGFQKLKWYLIPSNGIFKASILCFLWHCVYWSRVKEKKKKYLPRYKLNPLVKNISGQ